MIVIEIIMVVIGLAAVIASFRMSDNDDVKEVKAEVDTEEIDKKIKQAVKDTEEEIMNRANEKFSQISNDKIMGLNEYSSQVFDKIEKNHEETVFLYNMLTEKEKEIQRLIHSVDTTNADLRNETAKTYQEVKKQLSGVDDILKKMQLENIKSGQAGAHDGENSLTENDVSDAAAGDAAEPEITETADSPDPAGSIGSSLLDEEEAKAIAEITDSNEEYITEDETLFSDNKRNNESGISNSNSEIIALYKRGRSVLEISKMLSIGQGEVKFVIDLYNAR